MTARIDRSSSTWGGSASHAGLFLFLLLFLAAAPADARLRVWATEDPADAGNEPTDDPGDPWDETDANDEIDVNLVPGDELYIAVLNDDDTQRRKFWSIQLEGALVPDLALKGPGKAGYDGFQTADDTTPVAKALVGSTLLPQAKRLDFRFIPQPRWERIILTPFLGGNGKIKIVADSICTNMNSAFLDLTLSDTSIDSPRGAAGSPLFTEFWLFPRDNPADPLSPASFEAPPESGEWSIEFVDVDPTGNQRPLGVKFSTPGPGLTPMHRFDASFSMVGAADSTYDAFSFDAVEGRIASYTLSSQVEAVPAMGIGTRLTLAAVVAGLGAGLAGGRAARRGTGS